MSAGVHLFDYPASVETLSELRSRFADAVAKHQPLTHVMVFSADVKPPLPDALLQSLGRGNRPSVRCGVSKQIEPPYELLFGERAAVERYRELAQHAAERLPLWTSSLCHQWAYALYKLAWEKPALTSFTAPHKLLRLFASGAILTVHRKTAEAWPLMAERERAEGLCDPVAEVYCCQLADLWGASLEALGLWIKRQTPDAKQPEGNGGLPPDGKGTGKRGRQRVFDLEKDQEIAEAWRRAAETGTQKKDFVKDWSDNRNRHPDDRHSRLTLADLNRLLNRERQRRNRAD
jgi:hypothetical protein